MKVRHFPYIFIFLLFIIEKCLAQIQQVKFNLVSGSNGIALGKINGVTRDQQGVMWFSDQDHQCIIRYDGTQMTRFSHLPNDPNSLGGTYPECLLADSNGIIWIGFWGMGVDRFDPGTNTFTHFRHLANDTGSLSNDTISALLLDHRGELWVGDNGGLDLFNQKTGKFKHFSHSERDSTSLSDNIVRAIYEDHEGTLWVGTGFPWLEPADKGGLNRFNRETRTFTRYLNDPQNPHSLVNNKVRAIFEDSRGVFWVGTSGDGLHTMDRKTGVFERHPYNPARPEQLSRPPVIKSIGDHITFITEDVLGYIWIGTFGNGINRYDTVTKKVTHFGGDTDKPGAFKDNSTWWVNVSKDGLMWVCAQEPDLYRVDLLTSNIPHYETNIGVVRSFYEETPTILWFGADSGFIRKDLKAGTSRRYLNKTLNPNSWRNVSIRSIMKDEQGDFWLGTMEAGLDRFNPNTCIFSRYQHDPKNEESIGSDLVVAIAGERGSNLWVATGDGLDRMDRKTGKFTHYRNDPNDTNSIGMNLMTSLLVDGSNVLWAGTYFGGLNKLNLQTRKWKHYLPIAYVTCMYKDANGTIWAGAANGLYRYDQKSDDFSLLGEENTGFRINNVVSMVGDDQNNLWVASAPGIYRINPMRDQIILYDSRNGVGGFSSPNELNWGATAFKGEDGEIFFGATSGYYAFYPDKLKITASVPKIELTNFWLKGQAVKVAPKGPLTTPLSRTKAIHLSYDQNVFSLGFTAIDYCNPGDKIFYYKLENYDVDWRPAGADEKAYYFNVPPGNYVFRVRSSNSTTGASAEKDIPVMISGPWWKSWWAYGMYIFLLATGIFLFDRVQRRRLINRERERGMRRELEMQALRAQMNPHFIFNCLSSINNFITKNETEAASDYLTKFSRLIRTVLNNSKRSYIPLEDEIHMLGLYLEMEKLRFKDAFTYCIRLDTSMDSAALFIPPLLFQPFVENAIWHGLMHKSEPGRLEICLRVEKNILVCIIEDNGVGRSFARIAESKSVEKRKSMGIQITRQRLALMNGNPGIEGNDFVIEDLIDDVGNSAGTKVSLRIKYKEMNVDIV